MKITLNCPICNQRFWFDPLKDYALVRETGAICHECNKEEDDDPPDLIDQLDYHGRKNVVIMALLILALLIVIKSK